MAIERHTLHPAVEYDLQHYNGKGISVNFDFYHEDGETAFTFPGFVSVTLEIYDERQERRLFVFTSPNLTQSSNTIIVSIDPEDVSFSYLGNYYYHLYWLASGGYEEVLMYGKFEVI